MSLVKSKAIQLGFDATPTNNFLIYQPLTPDGTFRIANGNQGATTDIMTVTSGGSVTFAGTTNFSSLNFGAGSESAPSLFPTGDSNTGIWFPAADTFAVSTGGAERLRVDSSGNLGISGAASTWDSNSKVLEFPQGSLMGYGTTSMNIYQNAYLNANTVNTYKQSSIAAATFSLASGAFNWKQAAAGTAGSPITWTQPMTLDTNGRLGIGATALTQKLHVVGNAKLAGAQNGNVANLIMTRTDASWSINNETDLRLYVGSGDTDSPSTIHTTFNSAGNLIVGATTGPSSPVRATIIGPGMTQDAAIPAQVVVTSTEAYNASPTAGVSFWNKYNASGGYAGMGGISVAKANTTDGDYSSQLSLFTRPSSGAVTERIRITSAGNVGIANTSPNALLQIGAQYDVTGAVKHNPLIIGGRYSNNSSTTNQYQVMSFIGTTSYTDDIFTHTSGEAMKNYYVGLVTDNPYFNANRFAIIQGGAERLTIQGYGAAAGFVGIGTSAPQSKLHIGSGWVGLHSDINTSTAVPGWSTARITGEIHAGAGVGSGSDGGLLRLSAGGESSAAQKAGIDMSGYNTTDGGPTLRFYTGAERMRITGDGRVMINSLTSSNAIFECTTKGSDGNWGFRVMNPLAQMVFALMGDGTFYTGQAANSPYNKTTGAAANVYISSDVGMMYRSTSSLRYKTNVKDMKYGLTEALTLRPVTFQNINDEKETSYGGLIAEEVEKAGLVEFVDYDDDGRPDALHYGNMVSLCIKAIQELAEQNKQLQARLDAAGL